MDVPRFLVCNLAAADFFMGVYLGERKKKNKENISSFLIKMIIINSQKVREWGNVFVL